MLYGLSQLFMALGLVGLLVSCVALPPVSQLLGLMVAGALLVVGVLLRLSTQAPARPTAETHIHCPDCREPIMREARVCKHCGCKDIQRRNADA